MSCHYDILRNIRQSERMPHPPNIIQLVATPKGTRHSIFENQYIVPLDAHNHLKIEVPQWYELWASSRFFLGNQEIKPEKLKPFARSRKTRLTQLSSGQTVFVKFTPWGEPLPDLYLDELPIEYKEPQNWVEKSFIYFPFAMFIACRGGFVPTLTGITAISINTRLSRLPYARGKRLWLMALVNLFAFMIGYLLVGSLVAIMLLLGYNPFPQ